MCGNDLFYDSSLITKEYKWKTQSIDIYYLSLEAHNLNMDSSSQIYYDDGFISIYELA